MVKTSIFRLITLSSAKAAARAVACTAACAAVPLSAQSLRVGPVFTIEQENSLKSDGPETGLDSYALIQRVFGRRAIESPDLYDDNHPDVLHIIEEEDDIVGPHFVFLAHRDDDKDRDKDFTDRQRNEIKAYDKSDKSLKAYKNEVMQYRWKFKIDDEFEFSKNFTHFFQIKAKNLSKIRNPKDSDKYPILTISAVDKGKRGNLFELRHSPSLDENGNRQKFARLVEKEMSLFTGQWIEFFVQITHHDEGQLIFQAKNIETGALLVDYRNDNIDMWRGEGQGDFARPKWGIYRSLKDKESLRSAEERARFADFTITKGVIK